MSGLYLYDDARARAFEPFSLTRPVSELMSGAEITRRRWERAVDGKAVAFISSDHLAHFDEENAPRCASRDDIIPSGSLIANSRFVPSIGARLGSGQRDGFATFHSGDEVCAVRTDKEIRVSDLGDGARSLSSIASGGEAGSLAGRWIAEVWDFVGQLVDQLNDDIPQLASSLSGAVIENATILGKCSVYCETGARIEPFVVLDASAGPILIRRGATISSFSRVAGPCYIGENATVVGDAIRACSIGDVCKVRGEMSNSVMLGYSNKGHTGFVGHSYLGRWVNLGAGTTTSNLKNTYGNVQVWTPSGIRDTGAQFLGTLFGDHVKTGIGTMLTTGTVLGAGANVYGRTAPKYVPPFSWGDSEPYDTYDIEKFVDVAERMMARRHARLSEMAKKQLRDAYRATRGRAS